MNIKPRGLYGAMQRRNELQARIDSLTPKLKNMQVRNDNEVLPNPNPVNGQFSEILKGGLRPFNPMGSGVSRDINRAPDDILPLIQSAAQKAGIDPSLFEALVGRESSFRPDAVSIAGAQGLAQLMPRTAEMLGVTDVFDPEQNLNAGARYLAQMLRQFGGDVELALGAYNAGPGTVTQVGGVPGESTGYVQDIIRRSVEIGGR